MSSSAASFHGRKIAVGSGSHDLIAGQKARDGEGPKKPWMNEESLRTSVLNRGIPRDAYIARVSRPDPLVQVGVGGRTEPPIGPNLEKYKNFGS